MMTTSDTELANRILAAVSRSNPRNPARLDTLAEKLDADAGDVARVAGLLFDMRRLSRCDVTRPAYTGRLGVKHKAEAFTQVWPSGSVAPLQAFNGSSHRCLFVRLGSQSAAEHAARAPRVQPPPPATPPATEKPIVDARRGRSHRSSADVVAIMTAAVRGRDTANKISRVDLAEAVLPNSPNAVAGSSHTITRWLESAEAWWVAAIKEGRRTYYYDTRTTRSPRRSLLREAHESR